MRLIVILLIFFTLTAIYSCNSNNWNKDYKIKSAAIKEVKRRHWGKGYFIETMIFEYSINGQSYQNEFESNKKEQNYTSSYSVGDSLIFKYRPDNPTEIKVIKSKRIKK
ncbi:MAG: hypothetical protein DWP98_01080 [Bacteroidetes bacterium]|nr:MAG: hypothetical protein DWP98_01080 [Bacteroidota bacterium]MBL1143300.1 hypothetical protein [Bacteroidota bacterium]NOG56101.1 hypothetical protein [Bacteroidota bacterium]